MKIATWNVNSVRVRLPHVLLWLEEKKPDVLLLQETKVTPDKFPLADLYRLGYRCQQYGQSSYNGVAILSQLPMTDVVQGMPSRSDDSQARLIAATIEGIRVISVYVPNGQSLDSDKYIYKLDWLKDFSTYLATSAKQPTIAAGDYNIAPANVDIYDADDWGEGILASPPERSALQALLDMGYKDAHRLFDQPEKIFTWWDYRNAGFRRGHGLRIDLMLVNSVLAKRCVSCQADLAPRAWDRPSDHAPVLAEFAE